MPLLALIAGYVVVVLVGIMGLVVAWKMLKGKIDLHLLVSEKDGPASMSRFQFLIFTFVVAMCLLVLTLESGEFPKLDPNILGLLGISGGSFLVSKGIQSAQNQAQGQSGVPPGGQAAIRAGTAAAQAGQEAAQAGQAAAQAGRAAAEAGQAAAQRGGAVNEG